MFRVLGPLGFRVQGFMACRASGPSAPGLGRNKMESVVRVWGLGV